MVQLLGTMNVLNALSFSCEVKFAGMRQVYWGGTEQNINTHFKSKMNRLMFWIRDALHNALSNMMIFQDRFH